MKENGEIEAEDESWLITWSAPDSEILLIVAVISPEVNTRFSCLASKHYMPSRNAGPGRSESRS